MSHNVTSSRFKSFCHTNPHYDLRDRSPSTSPAATNLERDRAVTPPPSTISDDRNTDPNTDPDVQTRSIPHVDSDHHIPMSAANGAPQCCCGRPSCAYLEHNNAALGGLERDLETAARLGQALLHRHESYMASSESERLRLSNTIASLESEKSNLQAANDRIVAENRSLLDQLEGLNTSLSDSDAHVKSLEATLASAQLELRRLGVLACRTEALERDVADLERSRVLVEEELGEKREEGRSALRRWREAEDRVRVLEVEVGRIEREARGERERHEEVLERMERRGVVERGLGSAEGRLKAAAAVAGLSGNGKDVNGRTGNTSVVNHFVRDILQDNANLQAGVVELRELLQASNEEVQNLREQIMLHQPVEGSELEHDPESPMPSLEDQLWAQHLQHQQPVSQEVHVHHHYHAKFSTRKDRAPVARRQSRKRGPIGSGTGQGLLGSTPESSVPSTPVVRPQRHASSPLLPAFPSRQPAPRARSKRWSEQSAATGSTLSSLPSSPRSYFDRPSDSIFDRLEREEAYSRPTSPESAGGYGSPNTGLSVGHRKGKQSEFSLISFREIGEGNNAAGEDLTPRPTQGGVPALPNAVAEANEEVLEDDDKSPLDTSESRRTSITPLLAPLKQQLDSIPPDPDEGSPLLATFDDTDVEEIRPLRRSTSHDSLVSISGMDIHIAKRKPSQVFVISHGLSTSSISAPSPARTISTSQPLARIAEVTASSSKRSFSSDETSASLAMLSGLAGTPNRTTQIQGDSPVGHASGLGRLVGGWVRGKWGVAPMKSSSDLRAQAAVNVFAGGRPPGINQRGGIPGLRPPARTPSEIHAKVLDEGLLKETLAE